MQENHYLGLLQIGSNLSLTVENQVKWENVKTWQTISEKPVLSHIWTCGVCIPFSPPGQQILVYNQEAYSCMLLQTSLHEEKHYSHLIGLGANPLILLQSTGFWQ